MTAFIYRSEKQPNGDWGPGAPLEGDIESFSAAGAPMFYDNKLYLRQGGYPERTFVSEYDPNTDTFAYPDDTEFVNINKVGSNNTGPFRIGNTLLFQSDRDGTYDIWMSEWNEGEGRWDVPQKLPSPINTDANDEYTPWYSQANSTLYFSRNVSGGQAYQSQAIPEPSTLALLSMGGVALLAYARRKRRSR